MKRNLFENGKRFEEYTSAEFKNVYKTTLISAEDVKFFSAFKLNVLCISEKWCKDCAREVPLLAYIADKARWDMRIFGRNEDPLLMEEYFLGKKRKIPVFVFYDEDFKEIGRFIEKAPREKTTLEILKEILD